MHLQRGFHPGLLMTQRGVCPRCGFERPLSSFKREWTGQRVCSDCYEPRHPQDFVRGVKERRPRTDIAPPPAVINVTDYLLREDGSPFERESGICLFLPSCTTAKNAPASSVAIGSSEILPAMAIPLG